jgi:rhodanese-related sulfurtransferase
MSGEPSDKVSAAWLAAHPEITLIDLRPQEERMGELGFVPGSRTCKDEEELLELAAREPVVVMCLSGRRSTAQLARLKARGAAARELDGGLLAWRAAGLPVCEPLIVADAPTLGTLSDAPRKIASCFVAEQVELALDRDEEIDALALLRAIFAEQGVSWEAPDKEGLYRVLDAAGAQSLRLGNTLDRVARNMSRYYAAVQRLG